MVIRFFWKIHLYGKRETSQNDFSIACGAQVAYHVATKILDEIRSPSVVQTCSLFIHKPQNGLGWG
jgi:hypothetical protein